MKLQRLLFAATIGIGLALGMTLPALAQSPAKKPNILIIWGDDIGWYNSGQQDI